MLTNVRQRRIRVRTPSGVSIAPALSSATAKRASKETFAKKVSSVPSDSANVFQKSTSACRKKTALQSARMEGHAS